MADITAAIPTKKGRSRKALKPKNSTEKENHESFSGKKKTARSFEEEVRELKEKMEKMRIEKEETEAVLREREEVLREREAEISTRGKENDELKAELKRLHKIKEFKPTMSLPIAESMGEKEKNKKEKKKGGAQLKKPSTAYILWCKDQWNKVKKENPNADFGEITNILGTKWKTVSDEEKNPYEEKYQSDKEAYLKIVGIEKRENEAMRLLEDEQKQKTAMKLLDQYLQFKHEAEKDNKKTKKEKDPLKPKKPMSAFFVFINERRAELYAEKKSTVEVSKITGEEWKNMTENQKRLYEKMAKQNKEKYMEEMETYKQKKKEETSALKNQEEELLKIHKQEAMQMLKKKEKTDNIIKKTKENRHKEKIAKNDDPNRPRKPASSFLLFSKQARKDLLQERQGINNSTLTALISVKWKELTEEEKQLWNEKAAEAMEAYKKDLEEYNKSKAATENNTQE